MSGWLEVLSSVAGPFCLVGFAFTMCSLLMLGFQTVVIAVVAELRLYMMLRFLCEL